MQIVLDFYYFLELSISNFDRIAVKPDLALLIKELDPSETYCHVQLESLEGIPLKTPLLWWIKPWRVSYQKYLEDKQASELRRRKAVCFTYNKEQIAKAMAKKFGIPVDCCLPAASKIADKLDHEAAKVFNINLEIP